MNLAISSGPLPTWLQSVWSSPNWLDKSIKSLDLLRFRTPSVKVPRHINAATADYKILQYCPRHRFGLQREFYSDVGSPVFVSKTQRNVRRAGPL